MTHSLRIREGPRLLYINKKKLIKIKLASDFYCAFIGNVSKQIKSCISFIIILFSAGILIPCAHLCMQVKAKGSTVCTFSAKILGHLGVI